MRQKPPAEIFFACAHHNLSTRTAVILADEFVWVKTDHCLVYTRHQRNTPFQGHLPTYVYTLPALKNKEGTAVRTLTVTPSNPLYTLVRTDRQAQAARLPAPYGDPQAGS